MRFSSDATPLPPDRAEVRREWARMLLLCTVPVLIVLGVWGLREATSLSTPTMPATGTPFPSADVFSRSESFAALPPVLTPIPIIVITPEPTVTPTPRPTRASLPTVTPNYCGLGSNYGEICIWASFTPTPAPPPPPCETPSPGTECVWKGWASQ